MLLDNLAALEDLGRFNRGRALLSCRFVMTFGLDKWGQGLLRAFTLFGSGEQVETGHFALSRFAHLDEARCLVVARLREFNVG